MAGYTYKLGAVRAKKYTGKGDVRAYRAPKGWEAEAAVVDRNPITGTQLKTSQWWIIERYIGE